MKKLIQFLFLRTRCKACGKKSVKSLNVCNDCNPLFV